MPMSRGRKIAFVIAGLLLAGFLFVAVLGVLLFYALSSEPDIPDNSVLVLRVEGSLPDYTTAAPAVGRLFGGDTSSLSDLLTQLRKAKADKRVGAVLLDFGFLGTGWAKAEELRDAIADFRQSGKPIYAYMEVGSDKELFVATAAERVYVAPIGDLFINGLAAEAMFFRGTFDKLGIYWDGYQIGKYKTAPERFTRKEMSEAERETLGALLDGIFNRYTSKIAEARGKSVEDVKALIDNAPHNAVAAHAAGLIDGALYRGDVENELKKRLGYKDDAKLRKLSRAEYAQASEESLGLNEGERIAVVYAAGPINLGRSDDGAFGGEQTIGSDTIVKAINDARDDKSIKAIVLRVDSPGGSVYPSDLIWKAVEEAKAKKPVVVSMSDLAASGGYYVSMGANRIVAQPMTLTGSIGVFAYKPVMKEFYDWVGVSSEYLLRGKNAGMFRETERFTDEERKHFERLINHYYWNEFIPKAAKGRGRDTEYLNSVAQGRVWTGEQARERGLVDEFGGLDRAVEVAKELANIPAERGVRRVAYPAQRSFFQQLFGGDDQEVNAAARTEQQQRAAFINSLPREMRRTMRLASRFDRFGQNEALAILPFELEIE
ncbi:MAG TPA: signal peptide peptidase SppA [Pyrinomonadaceae bacterium]|nr:signal peptide peptidase SppA [Pyrinomonadaceae bacterium]